MSKIKEILKNIVLYLFSVKSLVIVPLDIYTDIKLALTHFDNGHNMWGSLTSVCLLPSLIFPYHYFHLLKFAWYKFKVLFITMNEEEFRKADENVRYLEKKNRNNDGIIAYFEDIPQFILQIYILWKTPESCFSWSWRDIDAVLSIVMSFFSISATVVPFYEKEKDEDWSLFSCEGFFWHFLTGTFLNVIPKLVLTSWTFSVLNLYGWFVIIAILLLCAIMACDYALWKPNSEKRKREKGNLCGYVLFRTLQLTFGYCGLEANFIVCILLLYFLLPLGINLSDTINPLEVTNSSDPFNLFPVDPYPSSTICFTNLTIIYLEDKWENKTTPFSNSCNKTFEAIPCYEVRNTIITKLSLMIGVCCGVLLLVSGTTLLVFSINKCKCCNDEDGEDEGAGGDNDSIIIKIILLFDKECESQHRD